MKNPVMMIHAPKGATHKRKILGRGPGTGRGCTSGRGNKGQKARSGYSKKIGFEGGQMPLVRRLPKRGFNNKKFERTYQVVNLRDLNRYKDGDTVDYDVLLKDRLVNKKNTYVKVLAKGDLTKRLNLMVDRISKKAKEIVEGLGGNVSL